MSRHRGRCLLLDSLLVCVLILFGLGLASESSVPVFLEKSLTLWVAILALMCVGLGLALLRWRFPSAVSAIAPSLNQAVIVVIISIGLYELVCFAAARYLPIQILLNTPAWVKHVLPENAFERPDFRTGRSDEVIDDPLFGLRYVPRLNVVHRRGQTSYRVITDSYGFPNVDESLYTQADVVVTGDSFSMGSGVEFEEAWPQHLSKMSGLRVLNLSQGGWDVYQYPLVLERFAMKASPKVVIVTVTTWNDLQPRFYEYEDYRNTHDQVRGFRDFSLKNSWKAEIGSQSNYLELALESSGRFLSLFAPFTVSTVSYVRNRIVPAPLCEFSLKGQKLRFQFQPYLWEVRRSTDGSQYLERVARDFARIRRLRGENRPLDLYVVYVPSMEEVYIPLLDQALDLNDHSKTLHANYASGRYDFRRYISRYQAAAHGGGVSIWDATPFLQEWAMKGEKLTWTDDSHPNGLGHRRIAEYVASILSEHGSGSIARQKGIRMVRAVKK